MTKATSDSVQHEPPLTVRQAAAYTAMSEATVRKWIADKLLPVMRLGRVGNRGRIRIRRADLDTFMASCVVGGEGRRTAVVAPKVKPTSRGELKVLRFRCRGVAKK